MSARDFVLAGLLGTLAYGSWHRLYVAPREDFLLRAAECAGSDPRPEAFNRCAEKVRGTPQEKTP